MCPLVHRCDESEGLGARERAVVGVEEVIPLGVIIPGIFVDEVLAGRERESSALAPSAAKCTLCCLCMVARSLGTSSVSPFVVFNNLVLACDFKLVEGTLTLSVRGPPR